MLVVLGALFLIVMFGLEAFFTAWSGFLRRKKRLTKKERTMDRGERSQHGVSRKWLTYLSKHLDQLLETLQVSISGQRLLYMLISVAVVGAILGWSLFQDVKGIVLCASMLAGLPYICLRMLLVHRRIGAQIDFLPAVELFYQCYLITGERQIKVTLAKVIEERRISGPMKSIFEQLYRNLSVRDNDEESLQIFAHALGHIWADYFVQMLRVSMYEGVSITKSLKQLIADMRAARRANELERHKLLEIRIANFTPILFLLLFIVINFRFNKEQSIYYYFHEPAGREMILQMIVMIFLSFLMGLYLSRKKMS